VAADGIVVSPLGVSAPVSTEIGFRDDGDESTALERCSDEPDVAEIWVILDRGSIVDSAGAAS